MTPWILLVSQIKADGSRCKVHPQEAYSDDGTLGVVVMTSVGAAHRKVLCYDQKKKPFMQAQLSEFGRVKPCYPAPELKVFVDDGESQWECQFKDKGEATKLVLEASIGLVSTFDATADGGVKEIEMSAGEGDEVGAPGDKAHISYVTYLHTPGALTLGNAVDSNYDCPLEFKIGSKIVIPAFDRGVTGMRRGGVRLLCAPSSMAYGSNGLPGRVPSNTTVVFHVTLSRLEKQGVASSTVSYSPADPFVSSLTADSSFDLSKGGESSAEASPFLDTALELGDTSHGAKTVPFALPPSVKKEDEDVQFRALNGVSGVSAHLQNAAKPAPSAFAHRGTDASSGLSSAPPLSSDSILREREGGNHKGVSRTGSEGATAVGGDEDVPGTPVPSLLGETIKSDKESLSVCDADTATEDAGSVSISPKKPSVLAGPRAGGSIFAPSATTSAVDGSAQVAISPLTPTSVSSPLSEGFTSNSSSIQQGSLFCRRRPDRSPVEINNALDVSLSVESSIDGGRPRLSEENRSESQVEPSPTGQWSQQQSEQQSQNQSEHSQQTGEEEIDPNVPPTFHFAGTCFISSINVKTGMFERVVLPDSYDDQGLLGCVILSHWSSKRKVGVHPQNR